MMEKAVGSPKSEEDKSKKFQILIEQVQADSFQPTINFEKCLARNFYKSLYGAVNNSFAHETNILELEEYLKCVLVVAERDKKFIPYFFASLEPQFYYNLTLIISMYHYF